MRRARHSPPHVLTHSVNVGMFLGYEDDGKVKNVRNYANVASGRGGRRGPFLASADVRPSSSSSSWPMRTQWLIDAGNP